MPRPRKTPVQDVVDGAVSNDTLEGFTRYHPARHQFAKREQQVVITRMGNFSLTSDLGELLLQDGNEKGWVQLAYNPQGNRIAIIQAAEGDPDRIRITKTPKGQRYQITAQRFLESCAIPLPTKGTPYQPAVRLIEGKQVLIIEI